MFVDKTKIYIKAGDGGDGIVSFHTEKFVPNGGPDGGDGGCGGSIIFEADSSKNTLTDFYYKKHYFAQDGEKGGTKRFVGKSGQDLKIVVPCGTVVREEQSGKIIADLFEHGQQVVVLRGGKGGFGNARFATATRQAPRFSRQGEKCDKFAVVLELMTIADVGLVGFANVGKSTLLSVISAAKPKIANYHFTTLTPNLGVVKYYEDSFTVADIPGLIEGASAGAGLGHDFLRHISRTRLLVHVVDISGVEGTDPYESYKTINNELTLYDKRLKKVPQIVALTKIDLLEDQQKIAEFAKKIRKKVYPICAITHEGIKELISAISAKLHTIPKSQPIEYDKEFMLDYKDMSEYFIDKTETGFFLHGNMIERMARSVVVNDLESFQSFQMALERKGIFDEMRDMGLEDGDIVRILDIEFEYNE